MFNLFEKIDLLKDLSLAKIVLHVIFLNGLDSHLLACELMDSQRHLTKGTFSDQLHELVEVQGGWRQLIVLFDVLLDIFYELVSLLQNRVIDFCLDFLVVVRVGFVV